MATWVKDWRKMATRAYYDTSQKLARLPNCAKKGRWRISYCSLISVDCWHALSYFEGDSVNAISSIDLEACAALRGP